MKRFGRSLAPFLVAAGALVLMSVTAEAAPNVNVNIGVPGPPPIVVASPPQLVVVPGSRVYYAPEMSVDFFSYGGRYYTVHDGAWFVARSHRGPEKMPRALRGDRAARPRRRHRRQGRRDPWSPRDACVIAMRRAFR